MSHAPFIYVCVSDNAITYTLSGHDVSVKDYTLECNVKLSFNITDEMKCHNYSIYNDNECELDQKEFFSIRLALVSTNGQSIHIHPDRGVANVTIDDSGEPECCELLES